MCVWILWGLSEVDVGSHFMFGSWEMSSVFSVPHYACTYTCYSHTHIYIHHHTYTLFHHQVIAQSLQAGLGSILHETKSTYAMCLPVAALIVCVVLVPLVVSFRKLSSSIWLCAANMGVLLVAILIVVGKLVGTGRAESVETRAFADSLTFFTLFEGATNIGA